MGRLPDRGSRPRTFWTCAAGCGFVTPFAPAHRVAQRIQAVLYHHGIPQHIADVGEARLARPPEVAGSGARAVTIALEVIDALNIQLAPFDMAFRVCARAAGCRADRSDLWRRGADLDHDPCRNSATPAGSPAPATPSATPGWTSPSTNPTSTAPPAPLPPRTTRAALGAV